MSEYFGKPLIFCRKKITQFLFSTEWIKYLTEFQGSILPKNNLVVLADNFVQ